MLGQFGSFLFFLLSFCFLESCNQSNRIEKIDLDSVKTDSLDFSSVELVEPVYRPRQLLLQQNRGVVTFFDDIEGGVFKVFSYPNYKFLFRYPEKGNERDESSFIDETNMEVLPHGIRYLDYPYLRDVMVDTISKTFVHESYIDLSEFSQDMQSVVKLDDGLICARNSFSQTSDLPYCFLSESTGKVFSFFGDFPDLDLDFANHEDKASFFRYRPIINRKLKRIMFFYVKVNKIRLYDFNGNLLKEVDVGPFLLPQRKQDERIYFESPISVGGKVYVLYFNDNHHDVNEDIENIRPELQVYSWDGELLGRYFAEKPLYKYAVDSINDKIIGITFSENDPVVEARILR